MEIVCSCVWSWKKGFGPALDVGTDRKRNKWLKWFLGTWAAGKHQPQPHNCTYKAQWHPCAWNPKGIVTQPVPSDLVTFPIPWSHLRSSKTYPLPLNGPDRRQRITLGSVPGGSDGKRICLQCKRPRFDPCIGKNPWRREWLPTPVFLPGESHRQKSLTGHSPWGCKESDTTSSSHNSLNPPDSPSWVSLTSILLSPCSPQQLQFRPSASHLGCCNHPAPHRHGAPALSLPWSILLSAVTREVSTWRCSQAWTPQCSFMV